MNRTSEMSKKRKNVSSDNHSFVNNTDSMNNDLKVTSSDETNQNSGEDEGESAKAAMYRINDIPISQMTLDMVK